MMETWGASVVPSPSPDTNAGRAMLASDPNCAGSLGLAISEAVEDAVTNPIPTKYALGSVLNHVLLHQTVIGLETRKQLELAGDAPDILIACAGGGSNFGGFTFPFLPEKLKGNNPKLRVIAVEPAAAPSLTRGVYAYDFGDLSMMTPLLKMYTLGHGFMPAPIHAGGLRYHGMAAQIGELYRHGFIEAIAVHQRATFEAGIQFARTEGILPAPESAHAIRAAIDEALKCREEGVSRTIVFNLSGHGHFDLASYDKYLTGKIEDYVLPDEEIRKAQTQLPVVA
jgi:tryptophan synthase beta chain